MGGVFLTHQEAPPMSVSRLKSLLHDARVELAALARHVGEEDTLSAKALSALVYSHNKLSAKITETLLKQPGKLDWSRPEPGSWYAKFGKLEVTIHKDGGQYYWQVCSTDQDPPLTFAEAEDAVAHLLDAN